MTVGLAGGDKGCKRKGWKSRLEGFLTPKAEKHGEVKERGMLDLKDDSV